MGLDRDIEHKLVLAHCVRQVWAVYRYIRITFSLWIVLEDDCHTCIVAFPPCRSLCMFFYLFYNTEYGTVKICTDIILQLSHRAGLHLLLLL
jgi:hypothetical protein